MQAITDWSKSLRFEVRGDDVVGHAGNVIPRMLADATGLTSGLSAALSRPEVLHDRGVVLREVAVSIAGGAQNLAGTAVPRPGQGVRAGVRTSLLHRRPASICEVVWPTTAHFSSLAVGDAASGVTRKMLRWNGNAKSKGLGQRVGGRLSRG